MTISCRLLLLPIVLCLVLLTFATAASGNEKPTGGSVKVEFMHSSLTSGRSFLLTQNNSTMFTHNAPLAPEDGIWGELVPFSPLDACKPLELSNYTRQTGSKIQFNTVGPYPHVVALVARGGCTFEEKFDLVDNVPNVIGMIMYDFVGGDNLSNDIEISTFQMTTIPGFLISYQTGQELLQQVNQMRAADAKNSSDPQWVKITLQYVPISGAVQSILQFVLLFVMGLLGLAFAISIYVHYRIYRLQQELGENRLGEARNTIVIDEAFLQKLPVRKFRKCISPTANDAAGVGEMNKISSYSDKMGKTSFPSPTSTDAALAAIEDDEGLIHAHAPPNETCPICLDEFGPEESLNELPCGHFYHMTCIQPWLQFRSPECPLCKEDVRDAYIVLPDPVSTQSASQTVYTRIKAWLRHVSCCFRDDAGIAGNADRLTARGNMTEVRIVTPTTSADSDGPTRRRDGTLHQVQLLSENSVNHV